MSERRGLHTFLGAIGLLAWLLFILGCVGWPAWSPDGTKILAPYFDPVAKQDGIALYDLKTRTARSIYAQPHDEEEILAAQFESDGSRAIVIRSDDESHSFQVTLLPVGSGRPARQFLLLDRRLATFPPLPELEGVLYIGGDQISRLDLRTGEALSTPFSSFLPKGTQAGESVENKLEEKVQIHLHSDGRRILYSQVKEGEDSMDVGTLDPGDLSRHLWFKLTKADLEARGLQESELPGFFAPEPRGSRLAILARSESGDSILLCSQSGLETVLKPALGVKDAHLGPPQWAPGGKLLYVPVAALVREVPGQSKVAQYWVAEVPIAGGRARLTSVARFSAEDSDWTSYFLYGLQVSLSPDGSTLATTTAALSKEAAPETKRALYLVNLRDPKRTVTSIPAPITRAPGKTAPAKTGKEQK